MDRRTSLQGAAAGTWNAASKASVGGWQAGTSAGRKMIGIQVGAVSFVDEGVKKVLDTF